MLFTEKSCLSSHFGAAENFCCFHYVLVDISKEVHLRDPIANWGLTVERNNRDEIRREKYYLQGLSIQIWQLLGTLGMTGKGMMGGEKNG